MMRVVRILLPLIALTCACPAKVEPAGRRLERFSELQIDGKALASRYQADLRKAYDAAPEIGCEVYDKPDLEIHELSGNTQETRISSVFLTARYIYPGLYLDAWTERMKGTTARCFAIDDAFRQLLVAYPAHTRPDDPL
ncbi:MAG: hypothetical protein ABIJ09_19840 [Pseudomonadota bacterium]